MISFLITLKYLHHYDKENIRFKANWPCLYLPYWLHKICPHILLYVYFKKKKDLFWMCIWKSNHVSVLQRMVYCIHLWPLFLLEACGGPRRWRMVSVTWQQQSAIFVECLPLSPQRGLCTEICTLYIYSQTSLSRTSWDCLKASRYPSIRNIEGKILKK